MHIAGLHEVMHQLVQRRALAALPAVVLIDEHRSAFALRDEDAADVRVAAVQQHVEIRPAFAPPREENDARRSRGRRAEGGVDLRQCGGQRLQLRGHGARPIFVRAADEDEMFRSRQQPLFINSREGNRSVRLPRRAVAFDPFEDRRDELGLRRRSEKYDEKDGASLHGAYRSAAGSAAGPPAARWRAAGATFLQSCACAQLTIASGWES